MGWDVLSVVVTYYGVGYHQATVPLYLLPKLLMVCIAYLLRCFQLELTHFDY